MLSKNGIIYNIGSYIILSIALFHVISIVIFYKKDIYILISIIEKIFANIKNKELIKNKKWKNSPKSKTDKHKKIFDINNNKLLKIKRKNDKIESIQIMNTKANPPK